MTPHPWSPAGGGGLARLLRAWTFLLIVLLPAAAVPAAGLDAIYLVRHAEKADPWPQDKELDAFWPLSPAGTARAEALAGRLEKAGIAAVYTSRTTRTLATAMPLVARNHIPMSKVTAADASIHPDEMAGFIAGLREQHAADAAVLIVGHSNTIPRLLVLLGAVPGCYARLGIADGQDSLLIEGYEGLWKVDLRRQGCEAIARE
jgi:broad specificity phosphatase PhoE